MDFINKLQGVIQDINAGQLSDQEVAMSLRKLVTTPPGTSGLPGEKGLNLRKSGPPVMTGKKF